MMSPLDHISQPDRAEALRALPKAYRDAPAEIQRDWLLGRGRQLLLLRKFTIAIGAFLLLVGFVRLSNDFVVNATELLLFALVIIVVLLAIKGLARARVRYQAHASCFEEKKDAQ